MDKLKMQSLNLVDANIDKIAALFPTCITEDRDDNGIVRRAVDFDQLRQELSVSLVEGPRERYTLGWPGKNEAILAANALIASFDSGITEELVKKLAYHKPLRVVFRDDAFGSDSVKINVEQIFKLLSPGTEIKSI